MDWFLSRWQYLADFYLVPVYALAALALGFLSATPSLSWCGYFAAGAIAWTLTEYVLHRWLFHWVYRREHNAHHAYPTRWIGVAPHFTGIFLLVLWVACVQNMGAGAGDSFFVGYLVGYYAYIGIHILIHHSSTPWVARLRASHELHHFGGVEKNFGVSTNFWDHVFRSYQAPSDV
jgi:sterol desaturase/sphingolipid hydroxylase (fatty acid hydroxylase superfamily)